MRSNDKDDYMNLKHPLSKGIASLSGKTIAITGATGGLGRHICRSVLSLSGALILLNRDTAKTETFRNTLLEEFPGAEIRCLSMDLSDMVSINKACKILNKMPVDVLIHNAGVYNIPRKTCETGYDNVFQINFVSPYYITKQLIPLLAQRGGKIVAVGSIAHTYSKTDPEDIDFSGRKKIHLVYGNSKRYLMFALAELMNRNRDVELSIVHPGITVTNITAHYPKLIYAVIKNPMKIIFMKPAKAARSIVSGIFEQVPYLHWIGPKYFNVWGNPSVKKLNSCTEQERERIFYAAESIYKEISADWQTS